jgi:hypothetical protein
MSFRIRHRVPAKDRASVAVLGSFAQVIVKAWQHSVVLVQDMHPISASPLNASIPGIRHTSVLRFSVK